METLPDEKERAARLRALEIEELRALRADINRLFDLLSSLDPEAAAFYDKAKALEARIGQAKE